MSDHDGTIVAIETGMLAGRDIGEAEEAVIREAIEHLRSFIGNRDSACFLCGQTRCMCEHAPTATSQL